MLSAGFCRTVVVALFASALTLAATFTRFPAVRPDTVFRSNYKLSQIQRFSSPILSLVTGPTSDLAVAATTDRHVTVWHLATGELVHEFVFSDPDPDARKDENDVEPIRVRLSSDGRILGISYLSWVHLYEIGTWREIKKIGKDGEDQLPPVPEPRLTTRPKVEHHDLNTDTREWLERKNRGDGRIRITDFAFANDGAVLIASYCGGCYDHPSIGTWKSPTGNDRVRLWNVNTGNVVWERLCDAHEITLAVVPSPNGREVVEAVFRPGVWSLPLRQLSDGQQIREISVPIFLRETPDIAFTPDGARFLTLWGEARKMPQLAMFDAGSEKLIRQFAGEAGALGLAVSSNGKWLAIATWARGSMRLWELDNHERPLLMAYPKFPGAHVRVLDVHFALNDQLLVANCDREGVVWTYKLAL